LVFHKNYANLLMYIFC